MDIEFLLELTKEKGGSDLHLAVGNSPVIRIHGLLKKLPMDVITPEDMTGVMKQLMNSKQFEYFSKTHDMDFAIDIPKVGRFRVNSFMQLRGEGMVFRFIPAKISSLEELGMPKVVGELTKKEKGLILVTGPTGSGKSTTLAAMIDKINSERHCHIITIEDPIEFVHENKNSIINQREIGLHTETFASALRSALREDPDVILVGEMRDLETISLALTAAETGHLVLSTLHTNSAPATVDRIIGVFPSDDRAYVRTQFAEAFEAVIAQNLVLTTDGKGRVAVLEIMTGERAVKSLIRDNKLHQIPSMIQTGTKHGMQTMKQSLDKLLMQGKISRQEVIKKGIQEEL